MDPESKASFVVEFLGEFAADRAEGIERPLAEYQARYPQASEEIAAAYEATRHEALPGDGTRIGPYRVEREIGRGGQGRVYLAHDDRLGRRVALKVVPRSPLTDDLAPRFEREAELAAKLDHPSLCTLFDCGHDDAVAWIAFRFVEGETLAARIARAPLAEEDALRFVERAARALHIAHLAGVVHRDVKPNNLMITSANEVVVLDFGIARHDGSNDGLTLTGQTLGTPAYMSPEALIEGAARSGVAADVWGLGVTLYEALTGRRPFEGATRDALGRSIAESEPPAPTRGDRRVSRDLEVVLETALAKEPNRRYRSALDFAEDLRRVREFAPILARPVGITVHLGRFARRNPAFAISLLVIAVLLIAALLVSSSLLFATQRTLEEKERLLGDFSQLSAATVARELLFEERSAWPAVPARVPDYERWLDSARTLVGKRADYESAKLRFDPLAGASREEATRRRWVHEQLTDLVTLLDRLGERTASIERRLELARTLERRTLAAPAAEWLAARERIRRDARFQTGNTGAFDLEPQLGLIPLGPDPDSKFEEFAVSVTGVAPQRDPITQRLVLAEDGALVLVLLPGGDCEFGARAPDADHPLGTPFVDPDLEPYEGPVCRVRLDPFFISKYEMTQGQWTRHAETNPSTYRRTSRMITDAHADLHPVETLDWNLAKTTLEQLGLILPTEAQWEFAARAGTTSQWSCGNDLESLRGVANLADAFALANGGHPNWRYEPSLDDGFVAHAPVGSLRANAFGLYDVHGNVAEWCRDSWEDRTEFPPRDGDGYSFDPSNVAHCVRGGAYSSPAREVRSASRGAFPLQITLFNGGVRPAREVMRSP